MLTAYNLACGYVETANHCHLWREGGVYHVRLVGWNRNPALWQVRHTLKEARAARAQIIKGV